MVAAAQVVAVMVEVVLVEVEMEAEAAAAVVPRVTQVVVAVASAHPLAQVGVGWAVAYTVEVVPEVVLLGVVETVGVAVVEEAMEEVAVAAVEAWAEAETVPVRRQSHIAAMWPERVLHTAIEESLADR